jgi:Cu2+-exporting ATPase
MNVAATDAVLAQLGFAEDPAFADLLTTSARSGLKTIDLYVPDMRCAACAGRIEKALGEVRGAQRVRCNPARHQLTIDFDPAQATLTQLLGCVERSGYTPLLTLPHRDDPDARTARHAQLKRIGVAGIGMMQVMMFAIALYAGDGGTMTTFYADLFRWIGLAFATPVVLYAAQPFFVGAWQSLRVRSAALSMDVPVAIAIGAAYAASVYATVAGHGAVYFDSVTMFTFFLLAARYLEQNARHRLVRFDDWLKLFPAQATRLVDGVAEQVTVARIHAGDTLLIRAGERAAADGVITDGASAFDEAWLTGESAPVEKCSGDTLFAGSLNLHQAVELRVASTPGTTRIASLQRLADRASLQRPGIVRSTDWIARYFITAILMTAALTYIGWSFYNPDGAFAAAIAVLVVSCPCALSLATPAALTAATTALRRVGFVITRADVLERLATVTDVVFDKTGTLTGANAQLVAVAPRADLDRATCIALASALERTASHPLARAFADAPNTLPISNSRVHPGAGVAGDYAGQPYRLGSASFCGIAPPQDAQTSSEIYLARAGELVASFTIRTALRIDAPDVIDRLRRLNLNVQILSGDAFEPTAAASEQLANVAFRAGVTPEQKLAHIHALQRAGRRIVMVGDGINDVPVLAAADASVTPLEATDLAKNVSDAILLSRGLAPLATAIAVARRTRRVIAQNLCWAFAYNAIAIPLAVLGLIAPWVAALGMSGSSLLVTLNALRLRHG